MSNIDIATYAYNNSPYKVDKKIPEKKTLTVLGNNSVDPLTSFRNNGMIYMIYAVYF